MMFIHRNISIALFIASIIDCRCLLPCPSVFWLCRSFVGSVFFLHILFGRWPWYEGFFLDWYQCFAPWVISLIDFWRLSWVFGDWISLSWESWNWIWFGFSCCLSITRSHSCHWSPKFVCFSHYSVPTNLMLAPFLLIVVGLIDWLMIKVKCPLTFSVGFWASDLIGLPTIHNVHGCFPGVWWSFTCLLSISFTFLLYFVVFQHSFLVSIYRNETERSQFDRSGNYDGCNSPWSIVNGGSKRRKAQYSPGRRVPTNNYAIWRKHGWCGIGSVGWELAEVDETGAGRWHQWFIWSLLWINQSRSINQSDWSMNRSGLVNRSFNPSIINW